MLLEHLIIGFNISFMIGIIMVITGDELGRRTHGKMCNVHTHTPLTYKQEQFKIIRRWRWVKFIGVLLVVITSMFHMGRGLVLYV
ncbi:MAG: hypothetical protein COA78_28415 [Blastopirellula sp.]|nr:MAG: hypothetical protein COA78_28415 [Blastopirellula sp.]